MMRYFAVMVAVLAISGSTGVKAQATCQNLSQTCQDDLPTSASTRAVLAPDPAGLLPPTIARRLSARYSQTWGSSPPATACQITRSRSSTSTAASATLIVQVSLTPESVT